MSIYPSDFENKIGFDALREMLSDFCVSAAGRRHVEEITFLTDHIVIKTMLRQVDEMMKLIEAGLDIPAVPPSDLGSSVAELRSAGNYLPADKLLILLHILMASSEICTFFSQCAENVSNPYRNLSDLFAVAPDCSSIVTLLKDKINKFGEIKDSASARLYEIRKEIRSASSSVSSVMRRAVEKYISRGIIDADSNPAMRDGRLCIPVSAMNKRKINGIVHDQSASGHTFFIEPAEVVEVSNRLRELQIDENHEIVRILVSVADSLRPQIENISQAISFLGLYDFIIAKAKLAAYIGADLPVIHDSAEFEWYHALHPVLLVNLRKQGREVVAQDLCLTNDKRILIISGPNAGGKSICLKTIAIVQYMMQCGLLPSVYSNSHMGIFDKLFINIGDDQSLENDLSTYSSHLRNMKYFIQHADSSTLFLVDEMGSGTEPQIGGALAQAILLDLNNKNAYGVVTTHFQNLKVLADSVSGFVNGAMLYDRQHLCPLFRLSTGVAGSSFALEIARNIGMPADIIRSAKNIVGSDYINMDKYLSDIARDRRYWSNKRLSIREKERKLEDVIARYEDDAVSLSSQRLQIIKDAKKEAKEIMSLANARLENAIHEIRKAEAEKNKTKEIRAELERYRKSLDSDIDDNKPKLFRKLEKNIRTGKKFKQEEKKDDNFAVGDFVRMEDGAVTGKILSVSGKTVEVAFGNLRTKVNLSKIIKTSKPNDIASQTPATLSDYQSRQRQLNFSREIDLRGMRADEALQAMTYFIDDAIQFDVGRVRILHGTGHGILRELIRKQLALTPGVAGFYDEDVRFGGAGITVVNLE